VNRQSLGSSVLTSDNFHHRARATGTAPRTPGENSARCGDPGSLQALHPGSRRSLDEIHQALTPLLKSRPLSATPRPITVRQSGQLFRGSGPSRQHPVWTDIMAGIAIRVPLEIILMLGLRLPEGPGRRDFCHDFARP
jgi:hypothetical protein